MLYRPQFRALLSVVPYGGTKEDRKSRAERDDTIGLELPIRKLRLERNDFTQADSCSVTVDWTETGLDPRMLDDGVLTVSIGNADEYRRWVPSAEDCVFIGLLRNVEKEISEGESPTVTLEAIDFTTLFLGAKPFGSLGIPSYSQTLRQAWETICSQTPGAQKLAKRLVAEGGVNLDTKLGQAVSPRFAKLSKVPTHPQTDAWAVWLQCVGMMGLVSYIDRDTCVVTTSLATRTDNDPPVLALRDMVRLRESRMSTLAQVSIGVVSYDPISGQTIEALYPSAADNAKNKKTAFAAQQIGASPAVESLRDDRDKREIFTMWGVTDRFVLSEIARRIYNHRTRQELAGRATLSEFYVNTASSKQFKLLTLRAGDAVHVDHRDETLLSVAAAPRSLREQFLIDRGYRPDVAKLIAVNAPAILTLGSVFYVTDVQLDVEVDGDGGSFTIEVGFVNQIKALQDDGT